VSNYLKKNKVLTNVYYQKSLGEPGIGGMLAPLVKSDQLSGDFYRVDRSKSDKSPDVTLVRAPGSAGQRQERKGRSIDNFRCVDHVLTEEIPFELLEGTQEFQVIEEQMQTASDIVTAIKTAHEREVHDIAWAANLGAFKSLLGGGHTPTVKWDAAGAAIKADLLTAKDAVYKKTGKRANTVVMSTEVFNKISTQDNEIRDVIKYTQNGMVTLEKLASYLEVETCIVPYFLADTTPGVSEEKDFLWQGDHCGVYYVDKSSQSRQKITFATTFYYDTMKRRWMQVYTGYSEETESEEVKVSAFWDLKVIDKECGYGIADVLA